MTHPSSSAGEEDFIRGFKEGVKACIGTLAYHRGLKVTRKIMEELKPEVPHAAAPGEQRGETVPPIDRECVICGCRWIESRCTECPVCHPQEGQPLPVAIPPKFRHVCPEWDGLEIDETWPEFEACLCFKPKVEAQPLPAGELFAGLEPVPDGAETYSDFVEAQPLPARIEGGTWEDLRCVELSPSEWSVLHGNDPERPGYAIIEPGQSSPEAAWKAVALKLEAQLSRQESAEDAWKRASESLRKIAVYCFNEWGMEEARNRMMDIRNHAYAPPISPDKEGQ